MQAKPDGPLTLALSLVGGEGSAKPQVRVG